MTLLRATGGTGKQRRGRMLESGLPVQISPTQVNVSIKIFNVMNIDEVENTIALKFEIKLEWFDHRLSFNDLKPHRLFLNKLHKLDIEKIWLPLIIYQSTDEFKTTRLERWGDEWVTRVTVVRKGSNFKRFRSPFSLKKILNKYSGVGWRNWTRGSYSKAQKNQL